jgi:dihydrofolate reductase
MVTALVFRGAVDHTQGEGAMRDVNLYMSMSLDGFVASDREHPGQAIPEGTELKQWKLDRMSKAGAHLMGGKRYEQMGPFWQQSDDPWDKSTANLLARTRSTCRRSGPPARTAR